MATDSSLLKGSLKDFSLVEIVQAMDLGAKTGALHINDTSGRAGILYFNQGKLSNCSELDAGALTLGEVLQQLGMATYEQIEYAFSHQLQNAFGMRIGERLMAMGVINQQQLLEALRMKAMWTARELGLWKDGIYEFISSPNGQSILPYGEVSLDLDVMRVTMEMVYYSDDWEKLTPLLPQGMQTMLQMAPTASYTLNISTYAYELLMQVNKQRKVRRVACAIHRPELDVARDLAQLVQHRLLMSVFHEASPTNGNDPFNGNGNGGWNSNGNDLFNGSGNGHNRRITVRLPDPAEKFRMETFELLDLISKMEQEWLRRRTPMEQLPALVEFINWTMDALAETCRAKGTELDPNSLETLLRRAGLTYMGNYRFKIEQNHIDVSNFTSLCYEVMSGDISKANDFFEEAATVLQNILRCVFETINARIADPIERLENQEVWEAMFTQFGLPS